MSLETVSVIITVYNGAKWIDCCFTSIANQTVLQNHLVQIEICVYDDSSTDDTPALLEFWKKIFEKSGLCMLLRRNKSGKPKGVGYGRNRAIEISSGDYLCFQDIDDEMFPERIEKQYMLAKNQHNAIIGTRFTRTPPESTCRFTHWANNLTNAQLILQIYTSNGPTVIMPTWFCHRSVYDNIPDGFCEIGQGTPEDLIFFYDHIDRGGQILRTVEYLLHYRYHAEATTFSITAETIWRVRLTHLLKHVLSFHPWTEGFTIWNAGKQGRRLYRELPDTIKMKVLAFCDVDKKKVNKFYQYFDITKRRTTHMVPIIHFTNAQKPLLICMKLNLTKGNFESNLKSLNLHEGKDYVLFT